jgi:hypothetical protein
VSNWSDRLQHSAGRVLSRISNRSQINPLRNAVKCSECSVLFRSLPGRRSATRFQTFEVCPETSNRSRRQALLRKRRKGSEVFRLFRSLPVAAPASQDGMVHHGVIPGRHSAVNCVEEKGRYFVLEDVTEKGQPREPRSCKHDTILSSLRRLPGSSWRSRLNGETDVQS